jgi:hypothetical protein
MSIPFSPTLHSGNVHVYLQILAFDFSNALAYFIKASVTKKPNVIDHRWLNVIKLFFLRYLQFEKEYLGMNTLAYFAKSSAV